MTHYSKERWKKFQDGTIYKAVGRVRRTQKDGGAQGQVTMGAMPTPSPKEGDLSNLVIVQA
jgi:hypothetical protein